MNIAARIFRFFNGPAGAGTTAPKFMQLLRNGPDAPPPIKVTNADDQEAHIYVYDIIDKYWGISGENFVKALNALTAPTIHMHVNTPGGDVFETRVMVTAIRNHKSKIIAHIDGLAASCGSWLATAANEVEMTQGGFLMIHQAQSWAFGNAGDMKAISDLLVKIDDSIIAEYVRKTGKTVDEIRNWLAAETWFTADEALQNKFVDRVFDGAAEPANKWNLAGAFNKVPDALKAPPTNSKDLDEQELLVMANRGRQLQLLEVSSTA